MVAKARTTDTTRTILCGTRYGNVMASRGSVIPLFIKQIREGNPMTITDPKMTRYLMSLEEAVDLVVYAFNNARQGDIFVQKAPASTIYDLAIALKELFNADNPIKIIGTRHGEKLYETLLTREERAKAEDLSGYYRIVPDERDLNYGKYFTEGEEKISEVEDYNSHNTRRLAVPDIVELLAGQAYVKELLAYR
jgi:UDP-glucose 4-epimerase